MKIKILNSASQDLIDGDRFYEKQTEGLGTYFLHTLFSDIDSLAIYAGIHPIHFGKYHRLLSKRFPFAIYYRVKKIQRLYMPFWIVVEVQHGQERD